MARKSKFELIKKVEKTPRIELSTKNFLELLEVVKPDLPRDRIMGGKFLTFAVGENYNIFITDKFHADLSEKYGVDLDTTLTEGNFRVIKGNVDVLFKPAVYQPNPGFHGNGKELESLKDAVRVKLFELIKKDF